MWNYSSGNTLIVMLIKCVQKSFFLLLFSVTEAHSRLKATSAFHVWEFRFKPESVSIKLNPFPIMRKVPIQTLGLSSEFVEALFVS